MTVKLKEIDQANSLAALSSWKGLKMGRSWSVEFQVPGDFADLVCGQN